MLNNFATALADLGDPKRGVYEFKLDEAGWILVQDLNGEIGQRLP